MRSRRPRIPGAGTDLTAPCRSAPAAAACRVVLPVLGNDRLERLSRPEFRRADFLQAGCVPIGASVRQRTARRHDLRNGGDVARFRVDVERSRIVLHHRDDLPRIRRRPTGAAIAAAAGIIHQFAERHVAVMVGMRAGRVFAKTHSLQHFRRMPADHALPGVRGLALAIELHEGTHESHVLLRCGAIIALERGFRLAGHIGAAGGQ